MRRLLVLLAACVLGGATLPTAGPADAATTPSGALHTSGTQIYDASGAAVRLRGLTRDGLERSSTGWNINEGEIGHAREWGANVVRIPLNEDYWTHLCPTTRYDYGYQSLVDRVVSSITSRGMVALLELNFNPRFFCDPLANRPQKMAASPGSAEFWAEVATRYANNPLVAFDLYNEPSNISDDVWLNGGLVSDGGLVWRAAGMQQLYNAVRGTGANNLVFVSGNSYAGRPPKTLLTGTNIVYAAHVFTCPAAPPPNCKAPHAIDPFGKIWVWTSSPDPYNPDPILDNWNTVALSYPVVVTEFGWPASDDGTYNANVISSAENRGWGWITFAWDGTTTGLFNLISDSDYNPSPSGVPVKQGLSIAP